MQRQTTRRAVERKLRAMPPDERTTKTADRCSMHPGVPSIARCDVCDLPLCVECAIPVRGRVVGRECLAELIGSAGGPAEMAEAGRRPARPGMGILGAAFIAATVATTLPWTRFGQSSGAFGAWGWTIRWSMLAAVSAVIGLALWAIQWRRPRLTDRLAARTLGSITVVVGIGALMAGLHEPPFTKATFVPWLALCASVLGIAGAVRANGRPGPSHP
jgi:hypothetical protein